jgi:hypothetical protein
MSRNKNKTFMSNFKNFSVERTIGFFDSHNNEKELRELFHILKREQFFSLNSPASFNDKLPFLIELNEVLKMIDIPDDIKLYFEYMEQIYKAMHQPYLEFENFYNELEKENKTEFFLLYLFSIYSQIWFELDQDIVKYRENLKDIEMFDSRDTLKISDKSGRVADIDAYMEFLANFVQQNINFYKYKKKINSITIKPEGYSDKEIDQELNNLLKTYPLPALESFSSWINGKILIDRINLYDWKVLKLKIDKKIIYSLEARGRILNEFINSEFGNYLYGHLKFYAKSMEHLPRILNEAKLKNSQKVIELTYNYIVEDFQTNYYIEEDFFNSKYEGYSLKLYAYFYLIFQTKLFYFVEEKLNIYTFDDSILINLFLNQMNLFEDELDIEKEQEILNFLEKALNFFTNNGEDMFNYPFYRLNSYSYSYLVPNTIVNANIPRMLLERFSKVVSSKVLSKKGLILENFLLVNISLLELQGIKVLKNIFLKEKEKMIGEIDILLFDGKNLIIGELKNQTIPNDLQEIYKRKKDLKKATIQINKAKKYLLNNIDAMSKELNIDLRKVENIIPIVITSIDKIHNIVINDTLIVNALSIKIYFEKTNLALNKLDFDGNHEVIERKYYNKFLSIDDYLSFVRTNRLLKTMDFFKYKELKPITVFKNENIDFRISSLSEKE